MQYSTAIFNFAAVGIRCNFFTIELNTKTAGFPVEKGLTVRNVDGEKDKITEQITTYKIPPDKISTTKQQRYFIKPFFVTFQTFLFIEIMNRANIFITNH